MKNKLKKKQADTVSSGLVNDASTQPTAATSKTAASSTVALSADQPSYVFEVSQSEPDALNYVRAFGEDDIEIAADSPQHEASHPHGNVDSIKLTEPFPEQRQTESLAQRSAAAQRSQKAILIHLWVQSITTLIGSVVLGALAARASALIYAAHSRSNSRRL